MISMKQPSLVMHSCDVPGYKYVMDYTFNLTQGATAIDVVNLATMVIDKMNSGNGLHNLITNSHGSPGKIAVGGDGQKGIEPGDVAVFRPLKAKGIGKIWIVACKVGKINDPGNKAVALGLGLASEVGCPVIAGDVNQSVDSDFQGSSNPVGTIDDFEGVAYEFLPEGIISIYSVEQ